jgi:hypothetical protein
VVLEIGSAPKFLTQRKIQTAVALARKESRFDMKALLFLGMITCLAVERKAWTKETLTLCWHLF